MNNNHVNRRNFLRLSATAGAALAIAPVNIRAEESEAAKKKMPMRTLGARTGMKIPVLSMGVMRADNNSVVKAAYNSGITFFDTAHGYMNGRNEEMLGDFFADKSRDSYYLATKVKENAGNNAGEKFLEKFEISMKRLKMSYVDVLYYHAIDKVDDVNCASVVEAMMNLKKAGRAKYLGISTHSNEPNVINAAVDNGNYDVILTSYNFNQKHLAELNPAIERAAKAGLGIVAMKTMAGGYLDKNRTQKVNTKAALKWALQNPNIHTAIPGFTSFDMLEESLDSALNLKMTKDEKKFLAVDMNTLYCQGCRVCVDQCPARLPIPEMMRAYMYNYGYKSPAMAKDVITELALAENVCGNCAECKVQCTAGFRVAEKVRDITRLQAIPKEFLV